MDRAHFFEADAILAAGPCYTEIRILEKCWYLLLDGHIADIPSV